MDGASLQTDIVSDRRSEASGGWVDGHDSRVVSRRAQGGGGGGGQRQVEVLNTERRRALFWLIFFVPNEH